MPSNPLILCCPLLLLPSVFPSTWVFSNESALHIRCPKYWSFSFSISPSNEHPGPISFRMDWLDLLAVQGTLKRVFSSTPHPCCLLSAQSLGHVQLFAAAWTVAWQAPLSVGLFRQEYYSGLPFLPPGHLLDPGIKPTSYESSTSQVDSLLLSHWGSPITCKETSLTYPNLTKLSLSFGDSDKHLSKFYCKCI